MNMSHSIARIIVLILFSGNFCSPFEYVPLYENGTAIGQEKWGGICDSGLRQSPINLDTEDITSKAFRPFKFNNYNVPFLNATVRNNAGHTIQLDVNANEQIHRVSHGGLPGAFVMDQLHFHWASEHTVNNERFALEMHIVSHSERYRDLSQAINTENGIAVHAVTFKLGQFPNRHINTILDSVRPVQMNIGESAPLLRQLRPHALLPNTTSLYYRYNGSLTTPECNEGVIWTVFINPLWVTKEQVDRFKQTMGSNGRPLTHNYRQLQKRNGRPIVKSDIF